MKKVFNLLVVIGPVLTLMGVLGSDYYKRNKERTYIVAKDPNVLSLKSNDNLLPIANELGEITEVSNNHVKIKSSEVEVLESNVPSGYVIEEEIVYSAPKPLAFSCSKDPKPLPIPPIVELPKQEADWGVKKVGADEAQLVESGKDIKVCVLDTGIDKSHPDLKYLSGKNFTSSDSSDFQDRQEHGTHTAGLVAAVNNSFGVLGASQAKLLIGKVLDDSGNGTNAQIADGVYYCVEQGAQIISMSLGGPLRSRILENSLIYATNKGILVFAAAGNDGTNEVGYPAGYIMNNLYSISATDENDRLAYFSNYGKVEFTCPGVNILSTVPGGYDRFSGTSMATPICAGVAAIFLARKKPFVARDMGDKAKFGKGMLDAREAVK